MQAFFWYDPLSLSLNWRKIQSVVADVFNLNILRLSSIGGCLQLRLSVIEVVFQAFLNSVFSRYILKSLLDIS